MPFVETPVDDRSASRSPFIEARKDDQPANPSPFIEMPVENWRESRRPQLTETPIAVRRNADGRLAASCSLLKLRPQDPVNTMKRQAKTVPQVAEHLASYCPFIDKTLSQTLLRIILDRSLERSFELERSFDSVSFHRKLLIPFRQPVECVRKTTKD
jgi:hypothetical protein